MKEAFTVVLSLSLSGSLMVFGLLLIKPLIQKRVSQKWQYYIWLLVIARLLLPLTPEASLMGTVFQRMDSGAVQTEPAAPPERQGTAIPPQDNTAAEPASPQEYPTPVGGTPRSVLTQIGQNLWLIWLVTALVLFIRKMTIYQSFVKYIRAGWTEVSEIEVLERFGKLVEQKKVRRTVELYTHSLISSPLMIGFYRPRVVLPSADLPETEFRHTILHELTHCRRRDMLYKWLVQFTICVHWFNPVVYLMGREVGRTCELSCDEAVLGELSGNERRAYGETLLNAVGSGGEYKDSLASVTLNEGKALLKERLSAIMRFQKRGRLSALISVALTVALCLGGTVSGAYVFFSPAVQTPNTADSVKTRLSDRPAPGVAPGLTLVQKEYTLAELKNLDISGIVVGVGSESVSILRGGDTLKFAYYTGGENEYTLQREDDGGKTRWNLCLQAVSVGMDGAGPITLTVPDEMKLKVLMADTQSGDISMDSCTADFLSFETRSGQITVNGGGAGEFFAVETDTGNALISGAALPAGGAGDIGTVLNTTSGTIIIQPAGSAWDYSYSLDTAPEAQISVNGKQFSGGDGTINSSSKNSIYFESENGSLLVQDLKEGTLPLPAAAPSVTPAQSAAVGSLASAKKEYTVNALREMGVTGLRIEAISENIVVKQGGTSLLIEYVQSGDADYQWSTRDYEIYHGAFTTPEDIDMNGGKSGTLKELQFTSAVLPDGGERTIRVTLPSDPQYSRVVQLFSESGDIEVSGCESTAMISADSDSGFISIQNCAAPQLGAKSQSGSIAVRGCAVSELNAQTLSGAMTLALSGEAENYKMIIDTGAEAQISLGGKTYPGGEYVFHKNAPNVIYLDSGSGSIEIQETA